VFLVRCDTVKSPFGRGGLRFFLVLAGLFAGQSTYASIAAGVPLIVLGCFLHLWAKGCLHQNKVLTTVGPYAIVRHPFYLANSLVDGGLAVMSGWWVLWVFLPVWWLAVYLPVMRREELHLAALFPAASEEYRRRVPMFIPRRLPGKAELGGFSWRNRNVAQGCELPRILRFLAYPLLFYLVVQLRREGWLFLTNGYCLDLVVLSLLAGVYGASWMLASHLKFQRRLVPPLLSNAAGRMTMAVLFLAAIAVTTLMETELDWFVWPVGMALLSLAAIVHFRGGDTAALLAEGLVLVGAAILSELVWAAALPFLFYTVCLLDARLRPSDAVAVPITMSIRPATTRVFNLLLVASLLAVSAKEVFLDGLR